MGKAFIKELFRLGGIILLYIALPTTIGILIISSAQIFDIPFTMEPSQIICLGIIFASTLSRLDFFFRIEYGEIFFERNDLLYSIGGFILATITTFIVWPIATNRLSFLNQDISILQTTLLNLGTRIPFLIYKGILAIRIKQKEAEEEEKRKIEESEKAKRRAWEQELTDREERLRQREKASRQGQYGTDNVRPMRRHS